MLPNEKTHIAIYTQQCRRGGDEVLDFDWVDGIDEDGDPISDDHVLVELSESEAARYDEMSSRSGAGTDQFYRRIANTIRENL